MSIAMKENTNNEKVDNEDSSKCKQKIEGSMIGTSTIRENKGPKVQILSLSVTLPDHKDINIAIPFPNTTSKNPLFTLKEGTKFQTLYNFKVSDNAVNGLTYIFMVHKAGVKVKQVNKKLGTFSPREEPYTVEVDQGTVPTGILYRGSFFIKIKFVDDEGNCYLETSYYSDIRKDWGANDNLTSVKV